MASPTLAPPRARRPLPAILWVDVATKAALIALLVFAVVRDDLPQFQGKAMVGRALTYPISTLIVPIIFGLVWRSGRRPAYPYGLDITLGLPFLIDTAGTRSTSTTRSTGGTTSTTW